MRLVISTGNIAFFVVRLMLLLGQFNYGRRGILDATHTRLFTFGSFRRLLEDNAFVIEQVIGIPAPFPLALGRNRLANALLRLKSGLDPGFERDFCLSNACGVPAAADGRLAAGRCRRGQPSPDRRRSGG